MMITVHLLRCFLGGFFISILWCIQIGDHPPEDLAKFGYRLGKKIILKFKNPSHIWLHARIQYRNLAIFKKQLLNLATRETKEYIFLAIFENN